MDNGQWIMDNSQWILDNGQWIIGDILPIIHWLLPIFHHLLSIIHSSLSIIHYLLSIIHYPLSIIHYPLFLDIGFLQFGIWDAIDILVVGYLIFLIYKLLRGTVAFNIFVGVISLYTLWAVVKTLKMELLSLILGQFVSVGVIVIAIVFQPELRRFLLLLGNQTLRGRLKFLSSFTEKVEGNSLEILELRNAILELSKNHTGALIVLADNSTMLNVAESGVMMDAKISKALILSIFNKESPLHDGAIIIANHKILVAGSVLPLSESMNLPREAGLRHRAAVGITETASATAFTVSEENGKISMAYQGQLTRDLDEAALNELLEKYYS